MAVAARIPGAQLKLLEGTTSVPYLGDMEAVARPSTSSWAKARSQPGPRPNSPPAPPSSSSPTSSTPPRSPSAWATRVPGKARELDGALRAAIRECERHAGRGQAAGRRRARGLHFGARRRSTAALALRAGGRRGGAAAAPRHPRRRRDPRGRQRLRRRGQHRRAHQRRLAAPGEILVSATVRAWRARRRACRSRTAASTR